MSIRAFSGVLAAGATLAAAGTAAGAAGTTAGAAPAVTMMVIGKNRPLMGARTITLNAAQVAVGRRRCRVGAGTALAGLIDARLRPRVTNAAGCDPASMFVTKIGPDANRGAGGWQYKIGHVSPSVGAGDPLGRLRRGQHLLWFWCLRANACQRTLDLTVTSNRLSGETRVTVTGYDDNGHGTRVAGATLHLDASAPVMTGQDGTATLTISPGRHTLFASKAGLIQSFPQTIAR